MMDANEKVDYLIVKMREMEARVRKLEHRQDMAFGTSQKLDVVGTAGNGDRPILHLPAKGIR